MFRPLVYFNITSYSDTTVLLQTSNHVSSEASLHCQWTEDLMPSPRCRIISIDLSDGRSIDKALLVAGYDQDQSEVRGVLNMFICIHRGSTMATLKDILEGSVFQCLLCLIQTERR